MKNAWPRLFPVTAAVTAFRQPKKTVPASAAASPEAKICQEPYQVLEPAAGWPEGPVRVLFHRENSKSPWSPNPAIRLPGLEAVLARSAKTLVCVTESQAEMGHYDSGEPGYVPSWHITLVRFSDRNAYFYSGTELDGEIPPGGKVATWRGGGQSAKGNFRAGCVC